jgi:WD40 repeat protein
LYEAKELFKLLAHSGGADCVAFSPDSALLASGGRDNTIKLWNADNGEALVALKGHDKPVLSVAFHPKGALMASGSGDNTVRLWGLPSTSTM